MAQTHSTFRRLDDTAIMWRLAVHCVYLLLLDFHSVSQYHTFSDARNTQKSSLGCRTAYYMLINSIPQSCNTALEEITASLPNTSKQVESGDICTSYCITPLKQAALECQDINNIYSAISSRCCWNDHNQRCFSLSGHATIAELIEECGHYNSSHTSTGDNCTSTCSDAMAEATTSLGCCLPALLAGSSHQSLLEPVLWHWCIQEGPGQQCTRCSSAMATPLSGLTVLIVTTLTRQLI